MAGKRAKDVLQVAQGAPIIAELISWEFPRGMTFRLTDIVSAMNATGFNGKGALDLRTEQAFERAVKVMESNRIVERLEKTQATVSFQLNGKMLAGQSWDYPYEGRISLDLQTGLISCTDANVQVAMANELQKCMETRTITDVSRLLKAMLEKGCDLVSIKFPCAVYLVEASQIPHVVKVERCIVQLLGRMDRMPLAGGTVQGNAAVAGRTTDHVLDAIQSYEAALASLRHDSPASAVRAAWKKLADAQEMLSRLAGLVGPHLSMLEDHIAMLEYRIKSALTPASLRQACLL